MKRLLFVPALIATTAYAKAATLENPFLYTLPPDSELILTVPERPHHPHYQPPHSAVGFPVRFTAPVDAHRISVRNTDGSAAGYQISPIRSNESGKVKFATIHVDASPGDEFVLSASGESLSPSGRAAFAWQDKTSHFLSAGAQIVEVPKSAGAAAPGPVSSLDLGDGAVAMIKIDPGKRQLKSLKSERVAHGPVYTAHRLTYSFDEGATYTADVRVSPHTPHVAVSETVTGLNGDDGVTASISLEGFAPTNGSRRIGPGNPQLTATSNTAALAVFALDDDLWSADASPLVLRKRSKDAPAVLRWRLSAAEGGTSSRHYGLALHRLADAFALIANHPPGRPPRSTDTLAAWLYHYHTRMPLNATKDWRVDHDGARPSQLFNAYRIARLRLEHQYPELANIAAKVPAHPMASEWLAQAMSILADHPSGEVDHAHQHDSGNIDLGSLRLEGHPHDDGDHRVLSAHGYRVIVDTVTEGVSKLSFPAQGPDARNVIVTSPGELSVGIDGTLEHVSAGRRSVAVVGAESVNGVRGGANFRRGVGIKGAPDELPLRIGTRNREDLVFLSDVDSGRLKTDGGGYAFDGEFGITSGSSLALFSSSCEETVSNRIGSADLTLATTGLGVSAAYYPVGEGRAGAPVPRPGIGRFHAPHGGKVRLHFGAPEPAVYRPRGSLMAYWKFDEPEGRTVGNAKTPTLPAQVVGGKAEPKREMGVGFDKVSALVLGGGAHVETFFDTPLPTEHTITAWVKTKTPCTVWSKASGTARRFSAGSRWLHVDADGDAVATIALDEGVTTLRANTDLLDGKWHHIAWVAETGTQRLLVDGKPAAEAAATEMPAPAAPMRLAGSTTIPSGNGQRIDSPALVGAIDNVRVYNMSLRNHEVTGIHTVGVRHAPIVITSKPTTEMLAGETFNYDIEFTGAPFVQFRFTNLPEWMSFQGRLTGTPGPQHIGKTEKIIITGLCPWGPAQQEFTIDIKPPLVGEDWKAYVAGQPVETRRAAYGVEFDLPAGSGQFEFTNGTPLPQQTEILGAVETGDALQITLRPAAGANRYEVKLSDDAGTTWKHLVRGGATTLRAPLPPNGNYILSANAYNGERSSGPPVTFPVAVTRQPPPSPDAPKLELGSDSVRASWTAVPGAAQYTLSRRAAGEEKWSEIYSGPETQFDDSAAAGVIPRFEPPGLRANVARDLSGVTVYDYSLRASNGHGESASGASANTDPRGW